MEKELIITPQMVNFTKEIGLKINKMDLVLRHGKTALVTKDSIKKDKKMDKEYLIGLTDVCIKDNFLTIICKAKVYIFILMNPLFIFFHMT